jgi:hypothetical protein
MDQTLRCASALVIVGTAAFAGAGGCSSSNASPPGPDAGNGSDATSGVTDSAATNPDGASSSSDGGTGGAASYTYVLIDDMETTTHGPIELGGINTPQTPGYWFNFGAAVTGDTANPPIMMFAFTALPTPTTTYGGAMSAHAAHQVCALNGLYDVCGLGFEFAQVTDPDAGSAGAVGDVGDAAFAGDAASAHDAGGAGDAASTRDAASAGDAASTHDAASAAGDAASVRDAASVDAEVQNASDGGDAGPPIPKITVPFDISQYKGIVFWAKTTGDAGTLDLKVSFPDTDTDPRGGVCNGAAAGASGPNDPSQCYNSYSVHEMITGDWQRYTLLFADVMIEDFGYQSPGPWDGKKVYGINWQAQKNSEPDAGAETEDLWVDDVYFVK